MLYSFESEGFFQPFRPLWITQINFSTEAMKYTEKISTEKSYRFHFQFANAIKLYNKPLNSLLIAYWSAVGRKCTLLKINLSFEILFTKLLHRVFTSCFTA